MSADLITINEYKAYAGINSTNQDTAIATLVTKASELVRRICKRTFTDWVTTSKVDTFRSGTHLMLPETPLIAVQGVEFSEDFGKTYVDLVEYEDYVVNTDLSSVELVAGSLLDYNKAGAFKVTYTAGYTEIPEDLKLAILDLVTYYLRNDAAIKSSKAVGANTVQIEYITNTNLPAHIRRVLDLHTAYYG
jgi:uncharacterized phiE125 gp8 family phage protein